MSLVALQPPDSIGLVAFHHSGLTEALALRFHDRPGLGPYEGRALGVVGIGAAGPIWSACGSDGGTRAADLAWVVAQARHRTRSLDPGTHEMTLGLLERDPCTEMHRLVLGNGAARCFLSMDDLEHLADLMRRYADGARWRATWPIVWGPRRTAATGTRRVSPAGRTIP